MRSAAGDRSNELLLYLIYFYISLRTRSHIFGNRSEERGDKGDKGEKRAQGAEEVEGTRKTRGTRERRELRERSGAEEVEGTRETRGTREQLPITHYPLPTTNSLHHSPLIQFLSEIELIL
ncbi:hypothetical protein C7B80_12845 [Cyanosarcina cf. burmensis CCALA 770]|nr:hypothetical protein C7B80_12845 [Cyanosarcina cf. burmensis CCALA 770]